MDVLGLARKRGVWGKPFAKHGVLLLTCCNLVFSNNCFVSLPPRIRLPLSGLGELNHWFLLRVTEEPPSNLPTTRISGAGSLPEFLELFSVFGKAICMINKQFGCLLDAKIYSDTMHANFSCGRFATQ